MSDRTIVLYEDAVARRFEPFALTRPVASLVSGTLPVHARWARALGVSSATIVGPAQLSGFDEDVAMAEGEEIAAGTIVASSRFAPRLDGAAASSVEDADVAVWRCDERVAAVRLAEPLPVAALHGGSADLESLASPGAERRIGGWWHDAVWDFIRHLPTVLADDLTHAAARGGDVQYVTAAKATVLGTHAVTLSPPSGGFGTAVIEPHVVFDASAGPIHLAAGTHVHAFSRIVGPCYIGPGSTVLGGDVSGCSIGARCKVRGEIASSIVIGYSNKGHEGFVGHSILARWVNLGAGTTTSNLKNTYGAVSLWTPDGVMDTGLQFLGTLFGDHVKTGIGMMLTTGTVLGAGANVFGTAMPPRVVAPFSWGEGEPYTEFRLEKFLESAERMMGRRQVPLSDGMRQQLTAAHASRWTAESSR